MRNRYQAARHAGLALTHTLVNPQFNAERVRQGLSSPEAARRVVRPAGCVGLWLQRGV